MILRCPVYFDDFSCIAAACPDSCCKDWEVLVDACAAASYRQTPGPLGDALRKAMYEDHGDTYFRIENGRCPFWQADSLCRIQAEQGHEALCKTCRDFPRLTHDYGDFLEKGLCMSCPEAARLIFANPDALWVTREVPGGEAPEYDAADMALLLDTREAALALLRDRSRPLADALALLLMLGYRAQEWLDGGESAADFDPGSALETARSLAKAAEPALLPRFYLELELLTEAWRQRLEAPEYPKVWPESLRAMAIYAVQRYWLQAISDFDLAARVKMIVAGCILVKNLGGDPMATAQLYSKEIENDEDNVEAILDGAYTSPALTDDKLLGWLWEG